MLQKRIITTTSNYAQQRQLEVQYPFLLAIDPSVNNLGWATYDFSLGAEMYNIVGEGWHYGLIHPKGSNLQNKWKDAYFKLKEVIGKDKHISHLAFEWPQYFNGLRGRLAAQQNYTVNLASLIGYLAGKLGVKAEFVSLWTPVQWKGSVPKYVTSSKFVRLFGHSARAVANTQSNDVIDAIMIAEFWLSLYNRQKFIWQQQTQCNVVKNII